MQDTIKRTVKFLIGLTVTFAVANYFAPDRNIIVYNCNEITMDFPDVVKEECKRIKEKKWKQQKTLLTI